MSITATNKLSHLLIYRNIANDQLAIDISQLLANPDNQTLGYSVASRLIETAETRGLSGNLYVSYLTRLLIEDENIFTLAVETNNNTVSKNLLTAAIHDITIIHSLLTANYSAVPANHFVENYTPTFAPQNKPNLLHNPDNTVAITPQDWLELLRNQYIQCGSGKLAAHAAFRWDDTGLAGITHYDTIRLSDIVGYETQKETLIQNTKAFLAGKPANNVLLAGARGTGKSSSVKALVNDYFHHGLRLVEITKHQLVQLNTIMETLRKRGKKFIIFLDDLSFEDFEVEYKHLKSAIEGGVETKPDNVLIYATSNRRHLIKETFGDRAGSTEEIHRFDTVNEKISLSDRFGITLTFLQPNQEEYLTIVNHLAQKNNIHLPAEQLRQAALHWELSHSGRSGRVAQQFINQLLGN